MNMHGILLSSDFREPVSRTLIECRDELNFPLLILSLKDLLEQIEIFDEIIEGVARIGWTLSDGTQITNSEECILINRVLSVPENLFHDFHPTDKEYALAEFRAYLAFAIEAFPLATSKPGSGGLSGNRFSLPRQWDIVQVSEIDIKIPEYYLGSSKYLSIKSIEHLVCSNPFNYYYWRPGVNPYENKDTNFYFLRPQGIPVVCSIIGEQVFAFPYLHGAILSEKMESKLLDIGQKLAVLFQYSVAESLLFVKGEEITFGMISNIPYTSKGKNFFSPCLIQAYNALISSEAHNVSRACC